MFDLADALSTAPPTDWTRLSLVYLHLLSCVFSLALVLGADWQVFKGNFTTESLGKTARHTSVLLVLLWITGVLLLHHDTGLDLAVMAEKSKLQLKVAVVAALTINGILLHFASFPLIAKERQLTLMESLLLSITGAISTSHWLLAAFVGVARPLAQWPVQTLLAMYALYVTISVVVAVACTPLVRRILSKRLHEPHPTTNRGARKRRGQALPVRYNDQANTLLPPDNWTSIVRNV